MKPAPVWICVISVFRVVNKYIRLPIMYNDGTSSFHSFHQYCPANWYGFHNAPFYSGTLAVISFFMRITYKLLLQIISPSSSHTGEFGLEAVLLYLLGFFFCVQALSCFWTVLFKLDSLVSILNLLLKMSKSRPPGFNGSINKIMISRTTSIDTGRAVVIAATLGFLGFPGLSSLVPFVMKSDPASHIANDLLPQRKYGTFRPILAGLIQGLVTAFGAIVCLQCLFVFVLIVFSKGEMMSFAITDQNLNQWPKLKNCASVAVQSNTAQSKVKPSLSKAVKNVRKTLDNEAKYFRPSYMIHRQLTIIQRISSDCLLVYTPGLIFVGMGLLIVTMFFRVRFDLPVSVGIPNTAIAITVSCIMVGVRPVVEGVDKASQSYQKFWTRRLRFELAKKLLISCRHCILVPIGEFTSFRRGTHLKIWNLIFQQLATLLINV